MEPAGFAVRGRRNNRIRRSCLLWTLAAVFAGVALLVAVFGLWQLPKVLSSQVTFVSATKTLSPGLEVSAPPFMTPAATRSPTSLPSPTATAVPTRTPTPTPGLASPAISAMSASADDETLTLTFRMEAGVPAGRHLVEAILWYDVASSHQLQRFAGGPGESPSFHYQHDAAYLGLTRTLTTTSTLDYWWFIRDSAGETARLGGTAVLGPDLQALVVPPTPELALRDFAWSQSESSHFRFFYAPGSAAERDLSQLVDLAEGALDHTSDALQVEFHDQMSVYFVPRIFWQGGAAYPDKVQLISYLDRNFTGIETWSYFAHEGTHALAQDLLQPKEDGGGPDRVLVEGLAVWASGGHYRLEPLDEWAAVVAGSADYLPLSELRNGPFYEFQHETAYLEAASFVKYLVENYGLDSVKQLYGQSTGDEEHDDDLVKRLFGRDYAALEGEWLAYLAGLSPTEEQVSAWELKVRSFDLMRRYESELDPDARLLPSVSPTEWASDTLGIYLQRAGEPVNVTLETALIAVQDRLHSGDPAGAESLLEDIEDALDAGGRLDAPSLRARREVLELLDTQERALILADGATYRATLDARYARDAEAMELLKMPINAYEQELVRLDLDDNGRVARGQVLVHGQEAGGPSGADGQLSAIIFVRSGDRWLIAGREPVRRVLTLPSALAE